MVFGAVYVGGVMLTLRLVSTSRQTGRAGLSNTILSHAKSCVDEQRPGNFDTGSFRSRLSQAPRGGHRGHADIEGLILGGSPLRENG